MFTKSDNIAVTVTSLSRVVMADGCGGGLYFRAVRAPKNPLDGVLLPLLRPVRPIHKMRRGMLIDDAALLTQYTTCMFSYQAAHCPLTADSDKADASSPASCCASPV